MLSPEEVQKRIAAGESHVIRQNIPREGATTYSDLVYGDITVPNSDLDDNVLLKSDGMPTYNLANVIDDHLMHITHVIRGVEYLSSTPKYNFLYDAMNWDRPVYIHLPPVMRDKQQKLSKRHGDASFKDFIDKGYLKEAIINYIALLGWSPGSEREIFTLERTGRGLLIGGAIQIPRYIRYRKAHLDERAIHPRFITGGIFAAGHALLRQMPAIRAFRFILIIPYIAAAAGNHDADLR